MRSDFVFQETRWLPLERSSDFSGIKEIMKTLLRHAKIFPPTPIWNIFSCHILPPLVRASIYNPERPALSTNSASLEISSLSLQIRLSSWEICSQRQISLQFHHLLGCYHPKKAENWAPLKGQTVKETMHLFSRFVFPAPFWLSWDCLRAISYLAPRLIFQPGLKFVM